MTNDQYVKNTLSTVDRILLDTSTAMSPGCQQFIKNNKELIREYGKQIVIPKSVYSELKRHLDSRNIEKSNHALNAINLIKTNDDIFRIEDIPLSEEEIAHAFADAQLLSELTLHRAEFNQLLITNDRSLSCDAFELNQQQSCRGHKVFVCYINKYGEMRRCDCAKARCIPSQMTVCSDTINDAGDNSPDVSEELHSWHFDGKSFFIGISCTGLLFGLIKGLSVVKKIIL